MSASNSSTYVVGPLIVLGVIGVLILLLRWAFARGSSLVERAPRAGRATEYGLLVAVGTPRSTTEGERFRSQLETDGIHATVTDTADGLRVMVFPDDAERATSLIRSWRANDA